LNVPISSTRRAPRPWTSSSSSLPTTPPESICGSARLARVSAASSARSSVGAVVCASAYVSIRGSTMSTLPQFYPQRRVQDRGGPRARSRRADSGYVAGVAKGQLQCFACDSPLEARYNYCPFCGVRLDSGVAEPAVRSDAAEPTKIYARERPRLFGVPPQDT